MPAKKATSQKRTTAARKQTTRKKSAGKQTVTGRRGSKRVAPASGGSRASRAWKPPEPTAEEKRRARTICRRLGKAYPDSKCSLDHRNPLELLVATILSAQCTDERVNIVTKDLFRKYPTAAHYARVPQETLEEDVRSTGFFRNKAKAIRGAGQVMVDDHAGQVPETMDELLRLPGVARKTANVVLGTAFGRATGVVVDTHVHRISRRLGLADHKDPGKVELELMALLPEKEWVSFAHRVIDHGRQICNARKPRCAECPLLDLCPGAEL